MKTMKKIMYVLTVTMLVALIFAVAAMAEVQTGTFGVYGATDGSEKALTWTFSDQKFTVDGKEYDANTMVISGTGTTWSFPEKSVQWDAGTNQWTYEGMPYKDVRTLATKVVITAPITKLPDRAFARFSSMTTILFPETYVDFDCAEIFNEIKTLTTIGVTGTDYVEGVLDLRHFTRINNEKALWYLATPKPVIYLPETCEYVSVEEGGGPSGMFALYYKYNTVMNFYCVAGTDGERLAKQTLNNASGWYTAAVLEVNIHTDGYNYDPTYVEPAKPQVPTGSGSAAGNTSAYSPYWTVDEGGKSGKFGVYDATDATATHLTWTYYDEKTTVGDKEYKGGTLVITGTGTTWSYPAKSVSYTGSGWSYNGLPWYHLRQEVTTIIVEAPIEKFPGNAFAGMTATKTVLLPTNYTKWNSASIFNGSNLISTVGLNKPDYVKGVIDLRDATYIDTTNAIAWFALTNCIVWLPGDTCEFTNAEFVEGTKQSGIFTLYNNNTGHVTFVCEPGSVGEKIARQTQENKNGYHTGKNFEVEISNDYTAPDVFDEPEIVKDNYDYNYENATASGHLLASTWLDANWYYFEDTKTLMLLSMKQDKGYCETGTVSSAEDKVGWANYTSEIEHIVIGPYISKITGGAFSGMSAVKDIRLGAQTTRVSSGAFNGMKSLTTIWRADGPRVEGDADFSKFTEMTANLADTAISRAIFGDKITSVTITFPINMKALGAYKITDEYDTYCKTNYIDLVDMGHGGVLVGDYGIDIDDSLPRCGARVVYSFDETTGTLTLTGAGITDDITNYYGGGSKNQWWFDFKNDIKHVIVDDLVGGIGKYAFCECENLETVELPNSENFEILNAAFESCTHLKSIYKRGETAIEGTADLRGVKKLQPWTFAYDYLLANIITDDNLESIGSTTFEENTNLMALYGVENGVASEYAASNNLKFFNSATATPDPITCEIPVKEEETTLPETEIETEPVETEPVETEPVETEPIETEPVETEPVTTEPVTEPVDVEPDGEGLSTGAIAGIIGGGCAVVAAAVVGIILAAKKKKKKAE